MEAKSTGREPAVWAVMICHWVSGSASHWLGCCWAGRKILPPPAGVVKELLPVCVCQVSGTGMRAPPSRLITVFGMSIAFTHVRQPSKSPGPHPPRPPPPH